MSSTQSYLRCNPLTIPYTLAMIFHYESSIHQAEESGHRPSHLAPQHYMIKRLYSRCICVGARDHGELASSAAIVPDREWIGGGVYKSWIFVYVPHAIALRASSAPGTLALAVPFVVCSHIPLLRQPRSLQTRFFTG